MNNVSLMQLALARNLENSISGLGSRPLEEAKFGLQNAQIQHQMGREKTQDERQAKMDAYAKPGLEVAQQVNQGYLDENDQDLSIGMMFPDMNTAEHMLWTRKDRSTKGGAGGGAGPQGTPGAAGMDSTDYDAPLISRFASMYGGHWDTDPNSPTYKKLVRSDGTTVKKVDVARNAEPIKAFMMANSGLKHQMQSAKEKELRKLQNNLISKPEYLKSIAKIEAVESDPSKQIQLLDRDIEYISRFVNPKNPLQFNTELSQGLLRKQASREKIAEKIEKNRDKLDDRDFEREKMRFDRNTKLLVAGMKEGKAPTQKEIDAQNALKMQHLVGKAKELGMLIQSTEDGIVASLTEKEGKRLKALGKPIGLSVYLEATGKERDRPGWFTGDDPLYTVSIVPDFGEKGSEPVQKPFESNNVNSFIDKQLNRYPDVNAEGEQPPAKPMGAVQQTPADLEIPEERFTKDATPTEYELDGKKIFQRGRTLVIDDGGKLRELNKKELAKIQDIIRKKEIETSPRIKLPTMPKVGPLIPGQGLPR